MIRSLFKVIFGLFLAISSVGVGGVTTALVSTAEGSGLALLIPLVSIVLAIFGVVLCVVGLFQFTSRLIRGTAKLGRTAIVQDKGD